MRHGHSHQHLQFELEADTKNSKGSYYGFTTASILERAGASYVVSHSLKHKYGTAKINSKLTPTAFPFNMFALEMFCFCIKKAVCMTSAHMTLWIDMNCHQEEHQKCFCCQRAFFLLFQSVCMFGK